MSFNFPSIAILLAFSLTSTARAQGCIGDVAADGRVDGGDLGVLLANWGPVTSTALSRACDFDGNASVDGSDLGLLLAGWGSCPVLAWATVLQANPDPAVVTDPALRSAVAATGLPWRVRDNGTGIEMLLVPPGTFQMGCSPSLLYACSESEFPVRTVTISRAFFIGRFEVTQSEWTSITGANPSFFWNYADSGQRPVEQVSWSDASSFAEGAGLRLPTEAEWEFACRAGTSTAFFNGSDDDATLGSIAWIGSNDGDQVRPVGQKLANRLGLHDMLGNVWEWVADFRGAYPAEAEVDPVGPASGSERICRGHTCFDGSYNNARSSSRDWGVPTLKHSWTGFRVARNP